MRIGMGVQICRVSDNKTGEERYVRILRKPINADVKEKYESYRDMFERLISLVTISLHL